MVYIADCGNNRISVLTTDGDFIRHFGHQGSEEGEFNNPYGITVDMLGNLILIITESLYYNQLLVLIFFLNLYLYYY